MRMIPRLQRVHVEWIEQARVDSPHDDGVGAEARRVRDATGQQLHRFQIVEGIGALDALLADTRKGVARRAGRVRADGNVRGARVEQPHDGCISWALRVHNQRRVVWFKLAKAAHRYIQHLQRANEAIRDCNDFHDAAAREARAATALARRRRVGQHGTCARSLFNAKIIKKSEDAQQQKWKIWQKSFTTKSCAMKTL